MPEPHRSLGIIENTLVSRRLNQPEEFRGKTGKVPCTYTAIIGVTTAVRGITALRMGLASDRSVLIVVALMPIIDLVHEGASQAVAVGAGAVTDCVAAVFGDALDCCHGGGAEEGEEKGFVRLHFEGIGKVSIGLFWAEERVLVYE